MYTTLLTKTFLLLQTIQRSPIVQQRLNTSGPPTKGPVQAIREFSEALLIANGEFRNMMLSWPMVIFPILFLFILNFRKIKPIRSLAVLILINGPFVFLVGMLLYFGIKTKQSAIQAFDEVTTPREKIYVIKRR